MYSKEDANPPSYTRLGDFHMSMSKTKTIKDIPALMPEMTFTDDLGTLALFKNLLCKKISNIPKQIKKSGKFA